MTAMRIFWRRHLGLAMWLVLAACAMKALIPAGFMLDQSGATGERVITVHICAESLGISDDVRRIVLPGHHDAQKGHAEAPCHFTALGHAVIGGADAIQIALALAFVLSLGFASLIPVPARTRAYLRPPLRGPPLPA